MDEGMTWHMAAEIQNNEPNWVNDLMQLDTLFM